MKEEEIRPQKIFKEYLRLCEIDCHEYFDNASFEVCVCPACENIGEFAFKKSGFTYKLCSLCETLFLSPRPCESAFSEYYIDAPSVKYWATSFYKETAEARREKIWKPKVKKVLDLIERYNAATFSIIDIGSGYGIFCEEMQKNMSTSITAIEPGPELANICRKKGLKVVDKFLENVQLSDLRHGPKLFTSFELFEHLHSPKKFLKSLNLLMDSGDIFIFTTLSGTGVDIQALWEDSQSVSPPHHLNFFNPRSIKILLQKLGYKILEIGTPGELDIDILENNQHLIKDRFWKTFIKNADKAKQKKWQTLISQSGLSSHMMVCCQKL
jgi:hypothetical protein